MAATSSQTPSSFGSTSSPTTWDVFVSFRGEDTRYNFTSYLYDKLVGCGIRTFMDDPELRMGEVITDALIQAIHGSKIYVVVFSENYAYSPWCLDELVEIYKCYENMNKLVIGVYYNIDPSVVRHQRESFGKAFEKHETGRFVSEMERVNNWRCTLQKVADFSGKHISQKRSQADIINEIVDEILLKINPKALDVAKYPVGLDSRVKSITALLNNGTDGVIKIGIYGMGGVGKTTLAKALYNQLLLNSFKGFSFLANVREISGTTKGLVSLQQQFIDDVLQRKKVVEVSNIEEGTMLIRERTCSKKILVIIDDIDDLKQYESLVGPFASGSVVIITTRDEEILDKIQVKPKHRYCVNELDDGESLALFTKHAFGNVEPNKTLMLLSKDILCLAGGLPLALEVFGSYLCSKQSEAGWKFFIEKLQRVPNSTIKQKLVISLDAIDSDDPMLKKIFLDIACFFIGWNKDKVVRILETYYSYTDHNIDILKKRCLVTINDDDELRMHDLLQDVGRDVARNNSPGEPGKYSRLWASVDICDVLKKQKGTEAIEGIVYSNYFWQDALKGVSLVGATFKHMSKLRFFYLQSNVNITGSFEDTFEELRWLYWKYCSLKHLPSNFCPQKLVILELPSSKMITMWVPHMVPEVFENLRTLNMSNSVDLSATPDFTYIPCLETLDLEGCESLEELHISIGNLTRLVSLNLCGCKKLRSLPDSICNLGALESLNIDSCSNLKALPFKMGDIKSLLKLNSSKLTILNLPDSIGRLRKLVHLTLTENGKLKTLPDSICNLRALEFLDISGCHRLKVLPTELGNIVSLKTLKAEGLHVLKLPDSIGHLRKLVHLKLSSNRNLEALPESLCNLRTLEVLDISYCCSLKTLPIELGNVESLKELSFYEANISRLPDSVSRLNRVVELILGCNRNLEILPDFICDMESLEVLDISYCEKIKKVPDQIWKITRLREIDVCGATLLEKLPDIEPSQIPLSLYKLDVAESGLTALPSGISQLSKLEYLNLAGCEHLLFITELPPNLKELSAFCCSSMETFQNLSNLKQLEKLSLAYCSGLIEIVGLEMLTSLQQLIMLGCRWSCVTSTLTKSLFQIYSEFGCGIIITIDEPEFPEWISKASSLGGSTVDIDLPPKLLHDPLFLGIILCFEIHGCSDAYIIKNTAGDIIWTGDFGDYGYGSKMAIVPRSMLSLTDEDHTIELTATDNDTIIYGVHLLYRD